MATKGTGWARGSNQYRKRPKPVRVVEPRPASRISLSQNAVSDRMALTGITWESDALDVGLIGHSTPDRVRARFRAQLPEFIWDAAALEGNPYTLPEVQTLLEGITISGRRLEDQNQILALNEGYNLVDQLVFNDTFKLDKVTSDQVHALVARHEAIESGAFRGEGQTGGGGLVGLGAQGQYRASDPGAGGETLLQEHRDLLDYLDTITDPREKAIAYFAAATHRQFYFDGNKRTARLMMTGVLMSHGYDAISVSASRQLEYNNYLTELFADHHATALMRFIIDSRAAN